MNTMKSSFLARVGIVASAAGLFFLLRPDVLKAVLNVPIQVRAAYRQDVESPNLIQKYLREHQVRKLQLGAGDNSYEGWLNTDIDPLENQAYLDASKPFPLPDSSLHYVFSEHLIEHLTYEQGMAMLRESRRVLAPGGKVRIATPNLTKFIELFRESPAQGARQYMKRAQDWHEWPRTADPACYILNSELRSWGHQFVYTRRMLVAALESLGFGEIKEFQPGESDDPALSGLEARARWGYRDVNAYETMVVQAVRP